MRSLNIEKEVLIGSIGELGKTNKACASKRAAQQHSGDSRMMKFLYRTIAVAAVLAMPSMAQAQYDITLTVTGHTINAGSGGGQFTISSVPALGGNLAYCIDQSRFVSVGSTYQYRVFTFAQYVAASFSAFSTLNNAQFVNELNQMAINAGTIALGAGPAANTAQFNTWSMFATAGDNFTNGAAPGFNNADWRVLVSVDAINAGDVVDGSQTFIASTVPEPSTYLLVASGLMFMGIASRRRKQV